MTLYFWDKGAPRRRRVYFWWFEPSGVNKDRLEVWHVPWSSAPALFHFSPFSLVPSISPPDEFSLSLQDRAITRPEIDRVAASAVWNSLTQMWNEKNSQQWKLANQAPCHIQQLPKKRERDIDYISGVEISSEAKIQAHVPDYQDSEA